MTFSLEMCVCGQTRMWHRGFRYSCLRAGCGCPFFRPARPLRHHYTEELPTVKLENPKRDPRDEEKKS